MIHEEGRGKSRRRTGTGIRRGGYNEKVGGKRLTFREWCGGMRGNCERKRERGIWSAENQQNGYLLFVGGGNRDRGGHSGRENPRNEAVCLGQSYVGAGQCGGIARLAGWLFFLSRKKQPEGGFVVCWG